MAKKELNVFNISFLDLLSGALAAVIILFILIPRLTTREVEELEALQQIADEVENLEEALERIRSHIPEEEYERLREQMEQLQNTVIELREQVTEMQQELQASLDENQQLRDHIADLQRQLEVCNAGTTQSSGGYQHPGEAIFGVNAKFAISIIWPENVDVDLWIKNKSTGEWCFYQRQNYPWGQYLSDIQSQDSDDPQFELFYQKIRTVPGEYEIWLHHYSRNGTATVDGFVVINPYQHDEQKVNLRQRIIRNTSQPPKGGGYHIANVSVRSNSFNLTQY